MCLDITDDLTVNSSEIYWCSHSHFILFVCIGCVAVCRYVSVILVHCWDKVHYHHCQLH